MLTVLLAAASAYSGAPVMSRPALRLASPMMAANIDFSPDGQVKPPPALKEPVRLLERVENLGVLSALAESGLLSSAESQGLFSKLEASGAFSSIEKLLPLADDLKLLSTAEALINVPSGVLVAAAGALVVGELGLISAVPDDTAALVALQAASGAVVGLTAVVLLASSYLFGLLQGTD